MLVILLSALRLAHFLGTTAEFWLNLQAHYEDSVFNQSSRYLFRGHRPRNSHLCFRIVVNQTREKESGQPEVKS